MPKKNLIKIPASIRTKLSKINIRYIVAGCLITYSREALLNGELKHLSIKFENDEIKKPNEIVPHSDRGKYSFRNINGYEEKRRDLPKETYPITFEAPNWGDSYNGTHEVTWYRERYQVESHSPRLSEIKIEFLDSSPNLENYTIKFEVSEVLDKESDNFDDRLLECLNLLQENLYQCGIEAVDSTITDYIESIQLSWEILPPGTKEEAIQRLFRDTKPTKEQENIVGDRYDFLLKLKPIKLIYGNSGFQRYFGALIRENLVVFENIRYGNAIYIMHENWEELSVRSRLELLSGRFGNNFERVIHRAGWKKKARNIIKGFLVSNN